MSRAYKYLVYFMGLLWIIMVLLDILYSLKIYGMDLKKFMNLPFIVFVIIPTPVPLFELPGIFTYYYMIFLLLLITIFFIYAIMNLSINRENSALFKIAEFFALNLFLSIVYFEFINSIGEPVHVPITNSVPFYINFYELTNAGLYEELITRVLYIGIPLFLYYRYKGIKMPWYRIIWGGNYRLGKPEITVWVISSVIFGIAHSAAWDWSKTPQAMLGGFLLGYLYLRYGLFADVLFHYSIDASDAILTTALGSPVANSSTQGILGLEYLVFIIGGIVVTANYIYLLVTGKYKEDRPHNKIIKVSQVPTCPNCHSTNATLIYDDIYKCNNCNTVFRKIN